MQQNLGARDRDADFDAIDVKMTLLGRRLIAEATAVGGVAFPGLRHAFDDLAAFKLEAQLQAAADRLTRRRAQRIEERRRGVVDVADLVLLSLRCGLTVR